MWFLQTDTFIGILVICFVMFLVNRMNAVGTTKRLVVLALLCFAFVAWVDWRLLALYLVYAAAVYFGCLVLGKLKRFRRIVFVIGVVACAIPLTAVRLWPGFEGLVIIGLAFAMLRAIDAVYYVYYTENTLKPLKFFNYMMFIPTFTAGPVFRYRDFEKQSDSLKTLSVIDVTETFMRIVRGFFKTTVLASILQRVFDHFIGGDYTLPISFMLVVCGWLILFLNLSGYADIAIAVGRFCGFIVPENFKKPWKAASFTVFWRSWHATVSDWIREHVYILVHNKKLGKAGSAGISVIVMLFIGLWHGFYLQIIIMSVNMGILMVIENLLGLTSPKGNSTPVTVLRCFAVNFLFGVNALLFFVDLSEVWAIVTGLFRI